MKDKVLMSGNEAAARGAFEAGVSFASAYPGTPSTEILENLARCEGVVAEWASNEKAAIETAIGASIGGVRSLCAMKHVGVNVAADPMFTFAYMGVNGGMVLVSADDPGMHSSQNEQDNRNYARFARIPMFEPSDSAESLAMMKEAFAVSERYDSLVMFRSTTRVCHSKSLVSLGERSVPKPVHYVRDRSKFDAVPAVSRRLRALLDEKFEKLREYSESCEFNFVEDNGSSVGIIASGISYQYAKEVFGESASYLKLGFTNPLPLRKIRDFASKVKTLYVIEELDPYVENQLKENGIACVGKAKLSGIGELNPDIIAKALLGREKPVIAFDESLVVDRPPVLCAGCPHRPFFYLLSKRKDWVVSGDIGCYGLGGNPPLNSKDLTVCMGSGFSIGHGIVRAFEAEKDPRVVIGVMGDSTFFHTGINSLINVVYNNSAVISVILDNRITGMTGHQDNPGTGFQLQGEPTVAIDIEAVVKALGVKNVRSVNPLNLSACDEALDWASDIVKERREPVVLITRWPCVLKKASAADREEFGLERKTCSIDEAACVGCKLCVKTGCPALIFDPARKKVRIDALQCVGCGLCAQVCQKQAIMTKAGE
jgi:indolepyruvate ferredoxin oxidoreductase, alpha subunit